VGDASDAAVIAASIDRPVEFGAIFDRHASALRRYLIRRLGPAESDDVLGDVFRIAFERRGTYDPERPSARPWLYGIATNLVARHRRREVRRVRAVAKLAGTRVTDDDHADVVSGVVDARERWTQVADAVTSLPAGELDVLVLHVWEGLSYEDVAVAVGIPVGTVRSRLNRARRRLRELEAVSGEERDEYEDPSVLSNAKEQFMSTIADAEQVTENLHTPDLYPRLAYRDELAAVEYLARVFGFEEIREARLEFDGHHLCWLRIGSGMVMVGHQNADVHHIHSPLDAGLTTVMMMVYVHDIDAHCAHAVEQGATITVELQDAFYGERRYEATDPEGHGWHFAERFADIVARGGRPPAEPADRKGGPDC
jgi:RNA polymerase sigma-70 factor (ECF subfamily)